MIEVGKPKTDLPWLGELGLHGTKPFFHTKSGAAFLGDSLAGMKKIPADSIDVVFTSPPFALTRQKEYGNEPVERYMAWFMPFCEEIKRILKPDGSFVLDLGGAWIPGAPVRSLYHFEVAIALSKMFKLAQDFYWYNPSKLPSPAEWVTVRRLRVKDSVNLVWWFAKTENPKADNRRVLRPYSASMKNLLKNGYKAQTRPSGHEISEKFSKDNGGAIPPNLFSEVETELPNSPNLLTIANTESTSAYIRRCKAMGMKPHPARFPAKLVEFFVDFLTDSEENIILDPFAGSNTTGSVAERKRRRWLAFEEKDEYMRGSMLRFIDAEIPTDPTIRSMICGESVAPK